MEHIPGERIVTDQDAGFITRVEELAYDLKVRDVMTTDLKSKMRRAGEDIIDLGMGNPDLPTPKHIVDKLCPAGVCKALIAYEIVGEKCDGCHACVHACSTGALTGIVKQNQLVVVGTDRLLRQVGSQQCRRADVQMQ